MGVHCNWPVSFDGTSRCYEYGLWKPDNTSALSRELKRPKEDR